MAIEKTVKINVESNLDEQTKKVKKLDDSVKDLDKTVESTSDSGIEKIGDGADKSNKSVGGLSTGFKGLGTAIKATGIGLLIAALASLASAISENERASRPFKVIMEAISIVMNDFVNAIVDAIEVADEATGGFDALGKVVGGLLTIAVNQLKISFLGIKLAIQGAQLIWENSFFGGKDANRIKELTEGIEETRIAIIATSESTVEAGKQVINNFGEAINEIGTLAEATIEEVSKVDVASARARAETNLDLARSAEIAAAQQALLVEQYDRQAEKLRQVRDNDLKGINDREIANNKLLEVLNNQEKAMLAQADAILASAAAQAAKNNNTENQVALLEAQANREGILAQIEGFRSEQESNRIALIKERQELELSGAEAEEQRALRQKQFDAEREEDAITQLELQKQILEEERVIEEERLQLKIDSFEQGTQARLDAENELKDRLQEIDQEITTNADAQSEARKKLNEKEAKSKKDNLDKTAGVLDNFAKLAGEQTAAGKTLAAASSTINTFRGVSDALAATTVTPFETALKFANATAIGVAGIANVKDILKVKVPGGGGGGSVPSSSVSGGGGAAQQAPAFNLVGASGVNQVQESLQEEQTPIQAFVVGSEVTTQQELDRNAVDSASIG